MSRTTKLSQWWFHLLISWRCVQIIPPVIRHSSMASLLQCQSVIYVVLYRMQIHIGVRLSCLVKKIRLEPTPKLLNYRPDICCAKNKVLFETKTLILFIYHNFFQHLLYHIQQSTRISWNYFVNNILQYVKPQMT